MRAIQVFAAGVLLAAISLIVPSAAQAQAPAPFGHRCTPMNGVRFCPTTDSPLPGQTVDGVPSFDDVPLDADVTLPATGAGPFPTIVMAHGWGGDKTSFETTSAEGDSNETYHYNNIFYGQHGYAVLNYTARGFGHSCGGGPTAVHTGACAAGYIHLDDSRYEAHDAQYLLGLLVDERITDPNKIGVTGISYGGGLSLELAYLKNRVRIVTGPATGALMPWTSPNNIPLSITAAYPRWEWSDLVDALFPNGRFLDTVVDDGTLSRNPLGIEKQSYINGLFALGEATGYYCGEPPASPCPDPSADLPGNFAQVSKGEPADPADMAADMAIADDTFNNHSAYSLPLPPGGPAPLLLENGWTDDLFPPSQALRVYNQIRSQYPGVTPSLQLGDLGHSRGSNKATLNQTLQDQAAQFFGAYLQGQPTAPAPGSVEAFTQTCPATTQDGGPFTASSWTALHPDTLSFGSSGPQTVLAAGDAQDGPPFDPITGTTDACKTISIIPASSAGTAVYTHPVTGHGFTLLGLPTVTATIKTTGVFGELDSRLYDVLPDGSERLISRGAYRLLDNQTGQITFQLHGNGYFFPPGDTVKLELRGNDSDYLRPSNNSAFTVQVSDLKASLPLAAG
jgi:fermentation-respiration switch protein FrsA (DUF1100 family)